MRTRIIILSIFLFVIVLTGIGYFLQRHTKPTSSPVKETLTPRLRSVQNSDQGYFIDYNDRLIANNIEINDEKISQSITYTSAHIIGQLIGVNEQNNEMLLTIKTSQNNSESFITISGATGDKKIGFADFSRSSVASSSAAKLLYPIFKSRIGSGINATVILSLNTNDSSNCLDDCQARLEILKKYQDANNKIIAGEKAEIVGPIMTIFLSKR